MIGSKILNLSYTLTNSDSASFLDANSTNIYEHLNTLYGHRVLQILRARVDRNATMNIATRDLLSTSGLSAGAVGYNGEYPFPTDLVRPVRMEVSYDGITWKKCKIYDNYANDNSEYNDEQLAADFSETYPMVDYVRGSFKIRPPKTSAGNITNGIYIEYEKRQSDFTSSTEPSEIEPNLQDILAYDLAELEMIMHPDRYTPQKIALFQNKKQQVERLFFDHYNKGLNSRKKMTFNYGMV